MNTEIKITQNDTSYIIQTSNIFDELWCINPKRIKMFILSTLNIKKSMTFIRLLHKYAKIFVSKFVFITSRTEFSLLLQQYNMNNKDDSDIIKRLVEYDSDFFNTVKNCFYDLIKSEKIMSIVDDISKIGENDLLMCYFYIHTPNLSNKQEYILPKYIEDSKIEDGTDVIENEFYGISYKNTQMNITITHCINNVLIGVSKLMDKVSTSGLIDIIYKNIYKSLKVYFELLDDVFKTCAIELLKIIDYVVDSRSNIKKLNKYLKVFFEGLMRLCIEIFVIEKHQEMNKRTFAVVDDIIQMLNMLFSINL